MGVESFLQAWSSSVTRKIVFSLVIVFLTLGIKRLVLQVVDSRIPEEKTHRFVVRKLVGYTVDFTMILVVFIIWAQPIMTDISVTLGILGAGLAFALQELIGALAGWLTIISTQPFNIGDRIEINGVKGDVIDIGPLFTKVLEIRNWIDYDYPTGRIVSVTNSAVFESPVFNYTYRFQFIWDQISIPVTYNSDWKKALEIMANAAKSHPEYTKLLPRARVALRKAKRDFAIDHVSLDPQVFVRLTDNWIELALIYPVESHMRPSVRSDIGRRILKEFDEAGITIASETIDIVHFPGAEERNRDTGSRVKSA